MLNFDRFVSYSLIQTKTDASLGVPLSPSLEFHSTTAMINNRCRILSIHLS